MPLAGSIHSALSRDEAPYFESLAALDTWLDKPKPKLEGVLPFPSKNSTSSSSNATNEETGRLLVKHSSILRRSSVSCAERASS
jgi:mannosyl-glycoprotein endo-beta-N-acetylglucosaminidase